MFSFVPASDDEVKTLRDAFLDSLEAQQEFYFERRNNGSEQHLIMRDARIIGYVLHKNTELLEFYIIEGERPGGEYAFAEMKQNFGITRASVQSFDPYCMLACMACGPQIQLGGYLYRSIYDPGFTVDPAVTARVAITADVADILSFNDGFFSGGDEILAYIKCGGLFVYSVAGKMIGCGLLMQVVPGRPGHDIGMLVAADERRRGYGTYVLRHIKHHCLTQGWQPIAGCHRDNVGSKRAIEKAGFTQAHRVIEFTW